MTADVAEPRLTVVRDWLTADDKYYSQARDSFITQTILAGADSVAKLMATTYLAQFKNLDSEFAQGPFYRPDFTIGYVPHSRLLLVHLNDVIKRGFVGAHVYAHTSGEKELEVSSSVENLDNSKANRELFVREGAQFQQLYQANRKILKGYDNRELFRAVRDCYFRDRKMAEILRYSEEPAVEEED